MVFTFYTLFKLFLVLLIQIHVISAVLTNVTVDDTLGDLSTGLQVSYTPSDGWTPGQNCTNCTAHPEPTQMLFNTWHDTSFFPNVDDSEGLSFTATITFNGLSHLFNESLMLCLANRFSSTGVAVYVFCAIDHSSNDPDGNSDMTFFIDGEEVGTFELAPTGQNNFSYHFPVFASDPLPSGPHTLTMENGHLGGSQALALLDYFIYT